MSDGTGGDDLIEAELRRLGYTRIWRIESSTDWRLPRLELLVTDLPSLAPRPWRGIRAIRQRLSRGRLLVLVPDGAAPEGAAALAAGADAVLSDAELELTLGPAVRAALRGQVVAPQEMLRASAPASLSAVQEVMLGELLRGHTNAQIAARAGLAESTVKGHVSALFRQLGVRSRAEVPGALESAASQAALSRSIPHRDRPSLSPSAER